MRPGYSTATACLLAGYEAASGHRLQDHAWFETFALYRLAAYTLRIVRVQELAGAEVTLPTEGTQFDLLEARLPD